MILTESIETQIEYKSGMGKESVLPPELKGWNWGAFLLNWVWGIGHSKFLTLLMFIPLVNVIMIFVIGAKGNKWAWQNRIWRDTAHFKATQKKWAIWGLGMWVLFIVVFPSSILFSLKGDAYTQSLALLKTNKEVIALVGQPIEAGFFVSGEISVQSESGETAINYDISGPKGEAVVYLQADKIVDKWIINAMVVLNEEKNKEIIVRKGKNK